MTRSEVREHLLNAPPGVSPGGVIAALKAQGVQIEGDPDSMPRPGSSLLGPAPSVAPPVPQLGFVEGSKKLIDSAANILPIAGGIAGGIAGEVIGAPTLAGIAAGPVIGGGLGMSAGEVAKHSLKQLIGTESTEIKPKEELMRTGEAGLVGLGTEIGGQYLSKGLELGAKAIGGKAGRVINSLIKPANREFRYGKDPGKAIVDEKITGKSLEDLYGKIAGIVNEEGKLEGGRLNEIGQQIQQKILGASKKSPAQIDVTKIIEDSFAPSLKEARSLPRTGQAQAEFLQNLQSDLIDKFGGTHTPLGVFEAKQGMQGMIKFNAADPMSGPKNEALWSIFQKLKEANNKAVSGLASLNERYSNLVGAKASIDRRIMNAQRANIGGLVPAVGGLASGAMEFARTGDLKKSLMVGGLGTAGLKVAGSTLLKTNEAQMMAAVPQAVRTLIENLGPAAKTGLRYLLDQSLDQSNKPQE